MSGAETNGGAAEDRPATREDMAEEMARRLERHPDYRVLRRFDSQLAVRGPATPLGGEFLTGAVLDVETTGLGPDAQITELAVQLFAFTREGQVLFLGQGRGWLNDPGIPIPPEVVELTGITDEMVRGRVVDYLELSQLMQGVALVVAHNADFDRQVLEKRIGGSFEALPWACSRTDAPWAAHGFRDRRLAALLADTRREFFDAHRALDDAVVTAALLGVQLGESSVLGHLLEAARTGVVRCWAFDAPFSSRFALKNRGYHWHDGSFGAPKAWWRDVAPAAAPEEHAHCARHFGARPRLQRISARDRYSLRAFELNPTKEVRDG